MKISELSGFQNTKTKQKHCKIKIGEHLNVLKYDMVSISQLQPNRNQFFKINN